ncbi:MAG: GAF domain-containing sensor histidine kinase [Gemmatimonadaceae bacterium]
MEHLPSAFAVTRGVEHTLVYANVAFRRLITLDSKLDAGASIASLFSSDDGRALIPLLDRAFRTRVISRNRSLQAMGAPAQPLRCTVWPDVNAEGETEQLLIELRPATLAETNGALQRQVAEQLLLSALREHDAAAAAHTSWRRAMFLAAESLRLSDSLDESATLAAMQRLSIPSLGAWSIVDLLKEDGSMLRLAIIHPDTPEQEMLEDIDGCWIPKVGDSFGLPAALRSRDDAVVIEGAAFANLRMSSDPRIIDALHKLGVTSFLTVPVIIEGQVKGAITFVGDEDGVHISTDEIALARDLANQSAIALERARLHGEALALKKRAESASEAKSTFLSMMSHELRTPLSAIAGYVDLLMLELRGPIAPEQRRDLGRIRANQRYLTGLIDELLTLSAAGSGRVVYQLSDLRAADLLSASCAMLEPLLREKSLTCDDSAVDPSIVAIGDREKVLQILVNLISNSIKFTSQGGHIWLDADADEESVKLRVFDSGIGIAVDKLDAIFEPFIQVTSGAARTDVGLGLGLAISRDLARAMRGELSVESKVGVGSTFTLTLPRAGAASTDSTHGAGSELSTDVHVDSLVHREP